MVMLASRLKGLKVEDEAIAIPYTPVLVGYRGSIAHNMFVPQEDPDSIDDKDIMAICLADPRVYLGFKQWEGAEKLADAGRYIYDIVTYEYRKFVRLLLKANPNVLSMLWLNEKHYIYMNEPGRELVENRDLFSSLRAYKTFSGYAHSQLKRMERWDRIDTEKPVTGRMGKKRKELAEKYGYDPKNAAHLIRLLRMGIEFLREGKLYVEREDAPELLQIKKGYWSLEKVKSEAEKLFDAAREAYIRSPLPSDPDEAAVEAMVMNTLRAHVNRG